MKIDIVIFSDPDYYPPTINAANILAERGHEVRLIGIRYTAAQKQQLNPSVRRIDYGSHKTGLRNIWQYFSFYVWYFARLGRKRPDWIVIYDSMPVGPIAFATRFYKTPWLLHNHDLLTQPKGWYRLISWIEKKFVKHATVISFPQEDRAVNFMQIAGLKTFPQIVYNGPRKSWSETKLPVHPELKEWVEESRFIVLYQGQFSKHFNLDVLIKSFTLLDENIVLCLIGRELEEGLIKDYQRIINEHGLSKRVKILPSLPYNEVPAVTAFCSIGVAKLGMDKSIPFNDYYLTGASNKVSEYLAFGLPVLMANTDVNRQFYEKYGASLFANGDSHEDIAFVLQHIAEDKNGIYRQLRLCAAKVGREIFNYDVQFSKIVSILEN